MLYELHYVTITATSLVAMFPQKYQYAASRIMSAIRKHPTVVKLSNDERLLQVVNNGIAYDTYDLLRNCIYQHLTPNEILYLPLKKVLLDAHVDLSPYIVNDDMRSFLTLSSQHSESVWQTYSMFKNGEKKKGN